MGVFKVYESYVKIESGDDCAPIVTEQDVADSELVDSAGMAAVRAALGRCSGVTFRFKLSYNGNSVVYESATEEESKFMREWERSFSR